MCLRFHYGILKLHGGGGGKGGAKAKVTQGAASSRAGVTRLRESDEQCLSPAFIHMAHCTLPRAPTWSGRGDSNAM